MSYHAWKRRLWGPDYPFENGPPYRDPATGNPMLPGGIMGGPYQGVDDDGPKSGNGFTITFTGPATGNLNIAVLIDDQTAAAGTGGQWVGAAISVASGTSATDIATAMAAAFDARGWAGWLPTTTAAGAVTFNPQSAGTATGNVIYGVYSGAMAVSTSEPTPVPDNPPPGPLDFETMTVPELDHYAEGLWADGDPEKPSGWASKSKGAKIQWLKDNI